MSQASSLPVEKKQTKMTLPQKIPITYLWFGKEVPEDYLISLSQLDYPVIFLKDPLIERKFSREIMDIEKSDYYRLQYLYEYGGIYSDFDNVINYTCLMNLLKPYRNQDKLIFMTDGKHTRKKLKQMTNNLIFAPYPKMPILKKIIDGVNEKQGKIWGFAGMRHVAKYSEPIELDMSKCVKHIGDWSWFSASNKVLKKKRVAHKQYTDKLLKKKDIVQQNKRLLNNVHREQMASQNLKKQITSITNDYEKLKNEVKKMQDQQKMKFIPSEKQTETVPKIKAQIEHNPTVTENVENLEWTKEKAIMRNQIEEMSTKNSHLEFQRDTSVLAVGGSLILLIILIIFGVLKMRKIKSQNFLHVQSTEKHTIDESKLDSR